MWVQKYYIFLACIILEKKRKEGIIICICLSNGSEHSRWKEFISYMISKELKKLSRRELVEIIYQMKKNEQRMQAEIDSLQADLRDKRIRLSEAGSIADAAASIANLFSAAQMTADLYLHEIACMKDAAKQECEKKIEAAKQTSTQIPSEDTNSLPT